MFTPKSVSEFLYGEHKAMLIIDNGMPVEGLMAILNQVMHYCVERKKEAENEAAQNLKDEEASKIPELEEVSAEEIVELEAVKEEPVQSEE